MNIWDEMEKKKDTFTKKERGIYDLVKTDPYSFQVSTAMDIAQKYHVSQSAISRFCQKLGFHSFSDFRMSMAINAVAYSKAQTAPASSDPNTYCYYLQTLLEKINQDCADEVFPKMIKQILKARTIYTAGYGSSAIAADWLALRLRLYYLNAFNVPSSREPEFFHTVNNKDLFIIFSATNPSMKDFFLLASDEPKEKRPYIILISNTKKHPFAHLADYNVILPSWQTLNYPYMIVPNITQLDFVMLLANVVAETVEAKRLNHR